MINLDRANQLQIVSYLSPSAMRDCMVSRAWHSMMLACAAIEIVKRVNGLAAKLFEILDEWKDKREAYEEIDKLKCIHPTSWAFETDRFFNEEFILTLQGYKNLRDIRGQIDKWLFNKFDKKLIHSGSQIKNDIRKLCDQELEINYQNWLANHDSDDPMEIDEETTPHETNGKAMIPHSSNQSHNGSSFDLEQALTKWILAQSQQDRNVFAYQILQAVHTQKITPGSSQNIIQSLAAAISALNKGQLMDQLILSFFFDLLRYQEFQMIYQYLPSQIPLIRQQFFDHTIPKYPELILAFLKQVPQSSQHALDLYHHGLTRLMRHYIKNDNDPERAFDIMQYGKPNPLCNEFLSLLAVCDYSDAQRLQYFVKIIKKYSLGGELNDFLKDIATQFLFSYIHRYGTMKVKKYLTPELISWMDKEPPIKFICYEFRYQLKKQENFESMLKLKKQFIEQHESHKDTLEPIFFEEIPWRMNFTNQDKAKIKKFAIDLLSHWNLIKNQFAIVLLLAECFCWLEMPDEMTKILDAVYTSAISNEKDDQMFKNLSGILNQINPYFVDRSQFDVAIKFIDHYFASEVDMRNEVFYKLIKIIKDKNKMQEASLHINSVLKKMQRNIGLDDRVALTYLGLTQI